MNDESISAPGVTDAAVSPEGPSFSVRMRARDLLNVAIFAVIYLFVSYAMIMPGLISPLIFVVALLLGVIVCSIPYLLFLTRVKHGGMVTLFGVVLGLVFALSGYGWIAFALTVLVSVAAEVILWFGRYRSQRAAIGAYTVFALSSAAPFVPLVIDREAYFTSSAVSGQTPEYVEAMEQILTLPVVWGYFGATLVCGLLGALLGIVLLKKHFVRAGLA